MRLRALAPAKVNLCLFLGPIRSDGRHTLVTLFESLSLFDELELRTLTEGHDRVQCAEVPGENLAERALAGLRDRGWAAPPVGVSITKRIPIAAGMAGGSADAAATLRLATALLPGRPEEVEAVAHSLGADVPAQLVPGLVLGTGAGEVVERLDELLAPHAFVVVPSTEALATPDVYSEADRLGLPRGLDDLRRLHAELSNVLHQDARLPGELLVNDLQPAAVSLCPSIGPVLEQVRETGAEHALVSGSGPTVVGLWWGDDALSRAREAAETLRRLHPGALAVTPVDATVAVPEVV